MAEYIVDIDAIWDLFDSGIVDKSEVHERIVRCRDCKYHYEEEPLYSLLPTTVKHMCGYWVTDHKVKPDGLCAWGEPKPTVEDQSKRWADPR